MIGQGYKLSNQEEKLSSIGGSPMAHLISPTDGSWAFKLFWMFVKTVTARKD